MSVIFCECLDPGECGVTEGLILLNFVVKSEVFSAKFRIQVTYVIKTHIIVYRFIIV